MIIVITSCSASKDDSISIPTGSKVVQPSYYLDDKGLISRLHSIRERIFQDPRACVGTKTTYAFDLYIRAGNAYRDLRKNNYQRLKSMLISSNDVEWFFLSGGYGIIHALEPAKKYRATFNKSIAYQKKIPFTANLWNGALTSICNNIVTKFDPEWIYVFGSRDYTNFVKQTNFWRTKNIKMLESTGSSGPFWLSPKLNELVNSILDNDLKAFNEKYAKFVKQ
jgi:cytoplasmic iron level regulating protein YaaA (DUF328/UPF0246 family)